MVAYRLFYHRCIHLFVCTVAIMLFHHTGQSSANIERICTFNSRPHQAGICGSQLADIVESLCRSFPRAYFMQSRKQRVKRTPERALIDSPLSAITLNPKQALSYLTKRGMTGTIVCECCYNQCSPYELLQYCDFSNFQERRRRTNTLPIHSTRSSTIEDSFNPGYYNN